MTPSNNLLSKLSTTYNFEASDIKLIYNGVNKVFRISSNTESLILKIFSTNSHTPSRISFERSITSYIQSNHLDCIEPILPNSKKEQTYEYENQTFYGIVTRECAGNLYSASSKNTQELLFGHALSKLHNCPTPPLTNPKTNKFNGSQLISSLKNLKSSPTIQLRKIITNLFHDIESSPNPYQQTQRHICHGDAWPGNALYSEAKCTLIDFEHARISDPAIDIATFLWWLTGVDISESKKTSAWNSFALGYGNTINSHINRHTPTLIKINQLRCLVFLHNEIKINEEILEHAHKQTAHILCRTTLEKSQEHLMEYLWRN